VRPQPHGKRFRRIDAHVENADRRRAGCRERRRDRRADAARADDQRAGAVDDAAFAAQATNEPFAVEQVADQSRLGIAADRIARASDLHCWRSNVEQGHGAHLVRHRDERAADVLEREDRAQESRVVLVPAAHRNDHRIDAGPLEVGVVDHRRLERVRRPADVGDQRGGSANHRMAPGDLEFELHSD
jgi:hypothetical protein